MKGIVLTALLAVSLLSGCSTTPEGVRRDRLGVQAATMALIERAASPSDKAQRILEAVGKVRTLLQLSGDVSVADLRAALLGRVVERNLSPLERLAALEVITSLSDEVEARLGAGLLTADTRVKVNTVLGWVEDAARIYVSLKTAT